MMRHAISRLIVASGLALLVAACQGGVEGAKHLRPIPAETVKLMAEKGMRKESPIVVRIYKEENKLEIWKRRDADGRFALLKDYEICRWSGTLGPKVREGDKQAPEGFYNVTQANLNPRSSYHLAVNMGYPNAYDRAHGRTGSHLMIHGDCLSAGCYALTDAQIEEVFSLAREAFRGGQSEFQIQAFPFRMTAQNMARRRNDPNFDFWQNLKEGSDHFEATGRIPTVNVCNRRYVFNAETQSGGFEPAGPCPAYSVPPSIADMVAARRAQDQATFARLVSEQAPVALAYVPQNGRMRRALGEPTHRGVMVGEYAPMPTRRPASVVAAAQRARPAAPTSTGSTGMFGWLRDAPPATISAPPRGAAPSGGPSLASASSRPVPAPPPPGAVQQRQEPQREPFYRRLPGLGWIGGGS